LPRKRFLRLSYPDQENFYSFNPDRIETVYLAPAVKEHQFEITVVMGSGTEHKILKNNFESAIQVFCKLSGSPPPETPFDDINKSYFPSA
jgi:hypothetical protein